MYLSCNTGKQFTEQHAVMAWYTPYTINDNGLRPAIDRRYYHVRSPQMYSNTVQSN